MEFMDVINARRSTREYQARPVEREKIERIIEAAVKAPSAMNKQPWAFGVITDPAVLRDYSERAKAFLLSKTDEWAWLAPYKHYFEDPNYNVFYNAPALVVIYSTDPMPVAGIDCALAAENLMLAACDQGLGSCWIGFSRDVMNSPEVKKELGVPEEYSVAAPIIVGYPAGPVDAPEKKPPVVVYWK